MLANHDKFNQQMRSRLKTTAMGLGLVRLLQDARRFDEAKTTLDLLENDFQGSDDEADNPIQVSGAGSYLSAPALSESAVAGMLTMPGGVF